MAAGSIRYMGSRDRSLQLLMGIPGGKATGQPGVLVLDTGAASPTAYKLFVDTGGNLRITSGTSYGDSDGTAFASGAGANTALSNLAAVAINTSLVSDAVDTDDIGSDALPWRTGYFRTSIVFDNATRNLTLTASEPAASARTVNFGDPGGNDSVCYLAASQALTTKTYDGLTIACASANQMILTRGTATITLTEGNTDILLAAGAQLDIAAAKTVNIDTNLTVNTVDVTLNQALASTSSPTFNALTVTSVTDGTATLTGGALTTTGALTCRGITNTNTAITSTVRIGVDADNVYLTVGASGDTDARIYFDGDDLCFWDSKTLTAYTLQTLATGTALNPTVSGDLAITDGKFTWTDLVNEAGGVWTFNNTAGIDIAQISAITTGTAYSITADSCANGKLLVLDADGDVGATGSYIYCFDGTNPMFTVGPKGATVIAGNAAGTAALTLTLGDVAISGGRITQTTTADTTNTFARNNATGTAAVVSIQEANATGGTTLLVNSDATDANDALQVTHDGTGYGLSVIGTAATGKQALFQGPASQTTSSVFVDGTTGSWIGAANVGMLHLSSDGALANADSSLIYSTYTGNVAAVQVTGTCAKLVDAGAAGTNTWALGITSTNNSGAIITTAAVGMSALKLVGPAAQTASMLILDGTATTGWGGAATTGMLHISLDGATLNATASALQIVIGTGTPTNQATGYSFRITDTTTATANPESTYSAYITSTNNSGMAIVTGAVGAKNLVLSGVQAQTASILSVDGTTGTGWVGAATTGMVHLTCDGPVAADGSLLRIASSGQPAAANDGVCLEIVESGAAQATSYALRIASTNNEALHVDAGVVLFDEQTTHSGGVVFPPDTTDVTAAAPTAAELNASSYGNANTHPAGFTFVVDDANTHTTMFIIISDGATYHWFKGTKCL